MGDALTQLVCFAVQDVGAVEVLHDVVVGLLGSSFWRKRVSVVFGRKVVGIK